jgi:copper(I)-binding protein
VQTDVSARRLLGALLVVTLPFAAGCGANRDSGTDNIDARPYSGSADAGELAVRAVRVIPAEDQFVSSSGDSSAEAYLTLAIVNTGTTADTLMNATVEGASVAPGGGPGSFRIEPHHTLSFGTPDLGHEGPTLEINGLVEPLVDGTTIAVSLTFADGGTVRTIAPVYPAEYVGSTNAEEPIKTTGSYPEAPEVESEE